MRLSESFETSELLDPIHQEIATLIAHSFQPIHEKIFKKFCDVITNERWTQIQENPFPSPYKSWEQIYNENPNEKNLTVIKLIKSSLEKPKDHDEGLRNLLFILTALRFEQENVYRFWMPRSKRLCKFLRFPYNDKFAMLGNEASPVAFGNLPVPIGEGTEGMTANKLSYTPDVERITEAEGRKWPRADRKAGVRSVIYYPLNDVEDQLNVGIACLCSLIPGLFGEKECELDEKERKLDEGERELGYKALEAFQKICDDSQMWIPARSAARIVPHRQREKILLSLNMMQTMMHLVPTQFCSAAADVAEATQSAIDRLRECGKAYQDIETKAQRALKTLHHGERISKALRLYAKQAQNGAHDQLPLLDIHDLLRESTAAYEALLSQQGVTIECQFSAQSSGVRGSQEQLMAAFMLILDNALDALSVRRMKDVPNKRLVIRTEADRSRKLLRIEISDTGQGMKPEILEHLKESLSNRQQVQRRRQHGTGMGMLIADEFLGEHGGKIDLENIRSVPYEEGRETFGTTIPIVLPLAEAEGG